MISIAKYLSASFQLYVTPIGGVKTTVKKFGNGGGITFTSPVPIGLINDETNAPFNIGEQISRWETNLLFFNPTNSLPSTKLPISLLNGVKVVKDTLKNMINYSMNYTYGSSLPAMVYNTHIDLKGIVLNTNAMVECEVISNYKLINTVYFNFNNPTGTKAFDISGVACANKPLEFRLANFNPEYIMTFDPDRFSGISQVVTVTEPILDPNVVTVNVDLSVVKKSNHSLAIKPNAYISIGVNELMPIALSDGKVTLKIKLDKTYILHAPLGSSYGIGQLSVTEVGNDYVATIILSIGSALGTEYSFTTPKNANKVVDLNYIIPVADADFNQMK